MKEIENLWFMVTIFTKFVKMSEILDEFFFAFNEKH